VSGYRTCGFIEKVLLRFARLPGIGMITIRFHYPRSDILFVAPLTQSAAYYDGIVKNGQSETTLVSL
jgi:hypothetical protein